MQDGLAQELVFGQPVKLGSQINSEDEELGPILSPDGKTMYFSRAFHANNVGGKYAGTDIWVSKKDDNGNWLPATNAGKPWNNKQSNAVIGINQDHTVVYLLNAYSNKSGIAFSKLYSGAWGAPEFIPIPGINRDDFVGFYVSPAFDVILISMKGKDSYGEEDLYVSLKDSFGKWTEPKNLGPTVNTKGFEISPFLSQDNKRLYFSSNGHTGLGDADIFYSDRLFESWETWVVPKNLGKSINTSGFEGYFSNSSDSIFLFSSIGRNTLCDIYLTGRGIGKSLSLAAKIIEETKALLTEMTEVNNINKDIKIRYGENARLLSDSRTQLGVVISEVKKNIRTLLIIRGDRKYFNSLRAYLIEQGVNTRQILMSDEVVRQSSDLANNYYLTIVSRN